MRDGMGNDSVFGGWWVIRVRDGDGGRSTLVWSGRGAEEDPRLFVRPEVVQQIAIVIVASAPMSLQQQQRRRSMLGYT